MGSPVDARVKRLVPSGITPLPWVPRIREHRFVVRGPVAVQNLQVRHSAAGAVRSETGRIRQREATPPGSATGRQA